MEAGGGALIDRGGAYLRKGLMEDLRYHFQVCLSWPDKSGTSVNYIIFRSIFSQVCYGFHFYAH